MKTLRRRIQDAKKAGGVGQLVVERDYAQSYVLGGLAQTDAIRESLVFKGDSALKKVHFGQYRFSEDLDFSMVDGPTGAALETAIQSAIARAQEAVQEIAPVTFSVGRYEERVVHPGGQEAFVVRVQFPWQRQPLVPVKLEVTHDEPVLLAAPARPIEHAYDEPFTARVRTYSLEEICAEKLRATRQTLARLDERGWARSRARDYYDLWYLAREPAGRVDWDQVSSILPEKCRLRHVAITSAADLFEARLLDEVRRSWDRTLGPFVRELPEIETVILEMRERIARLLRL